MDATLIAFSELRAYPNADRPRRFTNHSPRVPQVVGDGRLLRKAARWCRPKRLWVNSGLRA